MAEVVLLFDIGGTKMRLATARDDRTVRTPRILPTPQAFTAGIETFVRTARELIGPDQLRAVAGGVAGPLDRGKTRLVNAPNLPQWVGQPLAEELSGALGVPVFLENDTAMVGLGEVVAGAGQGARIAVYLTVSTGVGGCRFVAGRIDESAMGFEPGHQILDLDGPLCPSCGVPGHLEAYISGRAFERRFGKPPSQITDPAIWDEAARLLAVGLNNTIVHWSPEVIVLGGGMFRTPGIVLDRVRAYLAETVKIFPTLPELRHAALGDVGGLRGALVYLAAVRGPIGGR